MIRPFLSFFLALLWLGNAQAGTELAKGISAIDRLNRAIDAVKEDCPEVMGPTVELECAEAPGPARAEDSKNKKYFESLLKRGQKAPLSAFLKLWYPDEPAISDSPFFACEEGPSNSLKLKAGEPLSEDCRPDTLYSWGTLAKLRSIASRIPDGGPWEKNVNIKQRLIYASNSAVSTFGYGPYLVRFKIRKGIPFIGNKVEEGASVGVSDPWREYDFRESSAIESWSTGTPEIYDEVVRDILRYQSGARVESYTPPEEWPKRMKGTVEGLNRLYAQGEDGNIHDEKHLKEALLTLLRQILNKEGRVSYAPGACRNRARHFSTDKPSYINPRAYRN